MEVLLLGMFYQKGNHPIYDRLGEEVIDKKAFDAQSEILVKHEDANLIGGGTLQRPAKKSLDFYQ